MPVGGEGDGDGDSGARGAYMITRVMRGRMRGPKGEEGQGEEDIAAVII